jgi:maltose alpha-D-glucosyltransferase / alpha-amylase
VNLPADGSIIEDPQWYRDAVIYSCHVRSFQDSNGDGFGDFRGLADRLDYLQDLGVTAIWLLPFYPSPLRDDGYDIADYTSIHPDYGTMRQFKRFVREAHARGLKVITELVINHTSDQHPWFQRAVKSPPGSRYRDWYVWSDTPDPYPEVRIIFQDFETSNWTWHAEAGQYYWHRFFSHQPDLNFDNPEVHAALKGVLDFWAEVGVDGFRLDAIPYLYEREGTNGENLPETHGFLKELRAHLDQHWPGRMFLAEANQWPEDAAAYFGDGDECHMNFHFPLMPRLFMAVRQEDRFPVIDILQQTPEIPESSQWALFLRNHDELTLEMVTDEERDFMYRAYAHDSRMRINLGIRRRLSPLLGGDRRLIELLNSLLFSMPGTPVIYYGDEIGMGDNIWLGDRNGVRTPMQWSADRNAGFSSANPQRLYLPVVIDPEYHYERINVESQEENASSLLLWMRRLIALRQRHTGLFGRGDIEFVHPSNHKVLAYVRRWRAPEGGPEQEVLVVANLSRHAQAAEIPLEGQQGLSPIEMFGRTAFPPITDQPYPLTLGPYQFYWFSLERAPSRLSLSQMREHATATTPETLDPVPELTVSGEWRALLRGPGKERLEAALPAILSRQRWFGGKARTVTGCHVVDVAPLGPKDDPGAAPADRPRRVHRRGAGGVRGRRRLRRGGGRRAGRRDHATGGAGPRQGARSSGDRPVCSTTRCRTTPPVVCCSRPWPATAAHGPRPASWSASARAASAAEARTSDVHAKVLRGEQSNTSIIYGDRYLMKVLRRLEPGESPDVEIGRFLSGRIEHVPELLGTIDHRRRGSDTPSTLAILQRFVPNEGDAWVHTLDELERYAERVMTDPPPGGIPEPRGTTLEAARHELSEDAHGLVGPYLDVAHLLGVRTAEMHVALAGPRLPTTRARATRSHPSPSPASTSARCTSRCATPSVVGSSRPGRPPIVCRTNAPASGSRARRPGGGAARPAPHPLDHPDRDRPHPRPRGLPPRAGAVDRAGPRHHRLRGRAGSAARRAAAEALAPARRRGDAALVPVRVALGPALPGRAGRHHARPRVLRRAARSPRDLEPVGLHRLPPRLPRDRGRARVRPDRPRPHRHPARRLPAREGDLRARLRDEQPPRVGRHPAHRHRRRARRPARVTDRPGGPDVPSTPKRPVTPNDRPAPPGAATEAARCRRRPRRPRRRRPG